jgi:hypothetical protein
VCKTPREQQAAVAAGSLIERTDPTWNKRRRLDANLGVLLLAASFMKPEDEKPESGQAAGAPS